MIFFSPCLALFSPRANPKKKWCLRDRFRASLHSLILSITTFRTQIDSSEETSPDSKGRNFGRNLGTFGNYRHIAKIKVAVEENRSGEGGGSELAGINEGCLAHLNPIPPRL